eukprot:m.249465 g.249465  ORF g.249465 m.249465 type:complete len:65 (-) comp19524_c0_seq1:916-1110(-)
MSLFSIRIGFTGVGSVGAIERSMLAVYLSRLFFHVPSVTVPVYMNGMACRWWHTLFLEPLGGYY